MSTYTPPPHTRTWAITGGIGSGKSTVCRLLHARYALPIFYCDDEAKRIIRTDNGVKQALRQLIGEEVYDSEGTLCKTVLADYLCQGEPQAAQVNAIVHPRVAEAWHAFCADKTVALMECAILFESGFDALVNHTIAVTCEREERIRRIIARDHIDRSTALRWIALQWTDEAIRAKVHATIDTTSGKEADLIAQIDQHFSTVATDER